MTKTCENCAYMLTGPINPDTLSAQKICVRYPPQILVIHHPQGVQITNFNPAVMPDMFCGEFKLAENLIN